MARVSIFILVFLLLLTSLVFAGITGKITGKIFDAENDTPLPGVNVIVEGTYFGAATNINGNYIILNLPPGNYNLIFSMIGYAKYNVQNVNVKIDLTTEVNAALKSEVLVGEEVVVVAQRPVVTKDISNSQMNIDIKTIEVIPVQTVNEVLTLQAGIEMSSSGILVRGGGVNQTVMMMDGLSLNDERSNIPYSAVSLSSVQEINIQTGGFNAEYGNVRSGVVNIITKEGSRRRYNASANVQYSPPAQKHFGASVYDNYSYFNRPHMDAAVCWTGTDNGAWDEHTQKQYPYFQGWNAVSYATMQDKDPTNDLTPQGAKRVYEWQHRRQGDIKKPDYVVDIGFGGPIPLIGKKLGGLRFYVSHFREQDMFVFPLSRDNYGDNHTQLKVISEISPTMKLTLTGLYGEVHSSSEYSWKTTPTGGVLRTTYEVANLTDSSSGNSILYMPGYYSPSSVYRNMVGIKFSHVLSPNTFYNVTIQNKINRYHTFKMEDRNTSPVYEPVLGYYVDEAPYGYYGYAETGVDGMSLGGWMNLGRDKSVNSTTLMKFDFTSQVNMRNQVKAGLEVVYNDFNINSTTESPSMSTWTKSMIYHVFPFRIGAYLQDKLEFEGFIANLGLRLDYSDANSSVYLLDIYDKYFGAGYGNQLASEVPSADAQTKWKLSPRLGVSHPITDNSKLYFNYGHFFSEPSSSYRFRLQRESNGLVTNMGNPNMDLEKTVAYELGFSQNLYDMFLLNIAGYYKDVTNQPGWVYYRNINNSVQYSKMTNNNYQDIRGFELTLTKRIGKWITGFINYTYDVRTSGYFDLRYYYEDPNKQRDYLSLNPYQEKPHPRPYVRANIDLHTPSNYGPALFGFFHPIGGLNFNVLADWKTGSYYTYNPNEIPGVVDDTQWKNYYNIDLRLAKMFKFNKYDMQFYLDIRNALNTKRLSYAGSSYSYDWDDYLESLNFSWEKGVEHGNDRIGEYRDNGVAYDSLEPNPDDNPEIKKRNDKRKENKSYIDMPNISAFTFLNPLDITIGIRINF